MQTFYVNTKFLQRIVATTRFCVSTKGDVSMRRRFAMDGGIVMMVQMNRIVRHHGVLVMSLDAGMDSVCHGICSVMDVSTVGMVRMKRNVVSDFAYFVGEATICFFFN